MVSICLAVKRLELFHAMLWGLRTVRVPEGLRVEVIGVYDGVEDDAVCSLMKAVCRVAPFPVKIQFRPKTESRMEQGRCIAQALDQARGEIMLVCNDDVLLSPLFLERGLEVLDSGMEIYSPGIMIIRGGNTVKYWPGSLHPVRYVGIADLFRRDMVSESGLFAMEFTGWGVADVELTYRLFVVEGKRQLVDLREDSACFHLFHEQLPDNSPVNWEIFKAMYPGVDISRVDEWLTNRQVVIG